MPELKLIKTTKGIPRVINKQYVYKFKSPGNIEIIMKFPSSIDPTDKLEIELSGIHFIKD